MSNLVPAAYTFQHIIVKRFAPQLHHHEGTFGDFAKKSGHFLIYTIGTSRYNQTTNTFHRKCTFILFSQRVNRSISICSRLEIS